MSGFDSAGSVAGEIKDPSKTYPRGLAITVVIITITYIWPTVVGVSIQSDISDWTDGFWAQVAYEVDFHFFFSMSHSFLKHFSFLDGRYCLLYIS